MKFYILNPNIPGEKLDTVIPEISLVRNNVPQIGNLYFTNYQLIFQSLVYFLKRFSIFNFHFF